MSTGNGSLFRYFLLPAYITFDTTRAILTFAAVNSHISVSSTTITFCSELLKLIFAFVFLCRYVLKEEVGTLDMGSIKSAILFASPDSGVSDTWRAYAVFAVPAALYLINNLLYLLGLQLTVPSLLHVAMLAKLPFTGILHHFIIKRQSNGLAWLSLAGICAGIFIFNAPLDLLDWVSNYNDSATSPSPTNTATAVDSTAGIGMFVGPIVGLIIATISGFASIYTEVVMKKDVPFWVAQFWLYLYGTVFSGLILAFWDGRLASQTPVETSASSDDAPTMLFVIIATYSSVVIATAATGLVVANILRKADNLVKLVGTSTCIVTIILAQVILFPSLRATTIQTHTTLGAGIIAIATWTYNHYKSVQKPGWTVVAGDDEAEELVDMDAKMGAQADQKTRPSPTAEQPVNLPQSQTRTGDDLATPTWPKIAAASLVVAFLTWLTSAYSPSVAVHPDPTAYGTTVDDVQRFFVPHNITPAVWGDPDHPVDCIVDWVERENVLPRSSKLVDWEYTFLDSGCPVYPIPEGGLIFHQFWNGEWRKFQEFAIEAWLATQRLGDGHKLWYWYENGGPSDEVRERFTTGEYGKYVEFKEFDRQKEAAGYCVESMREYYDEEYRESLELGMQTFSDLVRNLLLAKYGGIWLDADTMPLRDMTPYIRSGPSAPYIGTNDSNNNLLVFGPASAGIGAKVLATTCKMSYNSTIFHESHPDVEPNFGWYWLYNDGMIKICQHVEHCGFGRIPIMFTDGKGFEGPDQESTEACDQLEKGQALPAGLHGLWTWHARLGARGDDCMEEDAENVGMAVRRRVRELLSYGLDMNGRDLFPGPGYAPQ